LGVQKIFARILPKLPKKKSLNVILGAISAHIFKELAQIFREFVKVFRDVFAQTPRIVPRLQGLLPKFTANQNLGVRLHP